MTNKRKQIEDDINKLMSDEYFSKQLERLNPVHKLNDSEYFSKQLERLNPALELSFGGIKISK